MWNVIKIAVAVIAAAGPIVIEIIEKANKK